MFAVGDLCRYITEREAEQQCTIGAYPYYGKIAVVLEVDNAESRKGHYSFCFIEGDQAWIWNAFLTKIEEND